MFVAQSLLVGLPPPSARSTEHRLRRTTSTSHHALPIQGRASIWLAVWSIPRRPASDGQGLLA